ATSGGQQVTQLNQPVTISFTLTPEELSSTSTADLVIAFFDTQSGLWVALPTTVDPITGEVSAVTSHFTTFAVFNSPVGVVGAISSHGVSAGMTTGLASKPSALYRVLAGKSCLARSLWIFPTGKPVGYVFGAPDFVNGEFPDHLGQKAIFIVLCE
ncbi:MAG: hypothetical protein WD967_02585, partial [Candidatus Levyibacteriota bacterium]